MISIRVIVPFACFGLNASLQSQPQQVVKANVFTQLAVNLDAFDSQFLKICHERANGSANGSDVSERCLIDSAALRSLDGTNSGRFSSSFAASAHSIDGVAPPPKVAYLFLIDDALWHPLVWSNFFKGAADTDYVIYVHATDTDLIASGHIEGLDGAKIIQMVPNGWCALFGVEVALVAAALEDESVQHLIFVSADSVPLKSFAETHQMLTTDAEHSTFCTSSEERTGTACGFFSSWDSSSLFPKHEQWITLSRLHAIALMKYARSALSAFVVEDIKADSACSDENVPLRAVLMDHWSSSSNAVHALAVKNVCRTFVYWPGCMPDSLGIDATTGVDKDTWNGKDVVVHHDPTGWHPSSFESVPASYLQALSQAGYLFMRKLSVNTTVTSGKGQRLKLPLDKALPA